MVAPGSTCTVETGLFRKKPCGAAAVAQCDNCEQFLCSQHAKPQLNEVGKRTGKFICEECQKALKAQEKNLAAVARAQEEKKKAEMARAAMEAVKNPPPVKKPAAPAAAPAAPAAPAPQGPQANDDGSLEFTPTKK